MLERGDGFVWVDTALGRRCAPALRRARLPPAGARGLPTAQPRADGAQRQRPLLRGRTAPLEGANGHVHMLELDQVIGDRFLVTVHGPINPVVDPDEALVETSAVRAVEAAGSPRQPRPSCRRHLLGAGPETAALVGLVAEKLPGLEQHVMQSKLSEPEALLERMFLIRHERITARTMAAQTHEVYARIGSLDRFVPEPARLLARPSPTSSTGCARLRTASRSSCSG